MNDAVKRRSLSATGRFAVSAAVVAAAGLVAGIGTGLLSDRSGPAAVAGTAGLIALMMAAALGTGVWWWAKLDEAAREAHKWAFWWGGSAGMAVGGVLLLTLVAHGENALLWAGIGETPAEAFGSGMVAILLFQLVGYTMAWAAWWLQRR